MKRLNISILLLFFSSIVFVGCENSNIPVSTTIDKTNKLNKSNSVATIGLVSPNDNAGINIQSVTLSWLPWDNPQGFTFIKYVVSVWDESTNQSIYYDIFTDINKTSTYVLGLSWNHAYRWTVVYYFRYNANGVIYGNSFERHFYTSSASPTISSSDYLNQWIDLSWSATGGVSYKLNRIGVIQGTIPDGWNNMGASTSVRDYPYSQPTFTSFVPGGFNFATYQITAINQFSIESKASAISYGVSYGGGGF